MSNERLSAAKNLAENTIDRGANISAVYCRHYNDLVWAVEHKISSQRIMVAIYDDDLNSILPDSVMKSSSSTILVEFPEIVSGWAAVFKLSPILEKERFILDEVLVTTLRHTYDDYDFIIQFWDNMNVLVLPKNVKKIDRNIVQVIFSQPFSGYVEMARSISISTVKDQTVNNWSFFFGKMDGRNILAQATDLTREMILPKTLQRVEGIEQRVSDNRLIFGWNEEEVTGYAHAIVHGVRI